MESITLSPARWIWAETNHIPNQWVSFRCKVEKPSAITEAPFYISVDTRYFLYTNGQLCIWDGGLFRDACETNSGFVDHFDLAPFLRSGENQLEILVWHYGNGGRNNVSHPLGGLIFSCPALNLYSDSHVLCQIHPSFYTIPDDPCSYLYGGYSIGYDSRLSLKEEAFVPVAIYDDSLFGPLYKRPIPMLRTSHVITEKAKKEGNLHTLSLPCMHHVAPYFHVLAKGGEKITITSDRYEVPGGPGGGFVHRYFGHQTEYLCKEGENIFLNYDYMACEALYFQIPEEVTVIGLGYRISEYDSDFMDLMKTDSPKLNRLMEKCARTLKVCMRDNFMDCPDRERGQWIGDVSIQAPQIFYLMDHNAIPLLRKAIENVIHFRQGDHIVGNIPGMHSSEYPCQSLHTISEFGMVAEYYHFTGDKTILSLVYPAAIAYLHLWEMGEDGLVKPRQDATRWYDHLFNVDDRILENTWYYSALSFAQTMAKILGITDDSDFLTSRKQSIADHFEQAFWKGRGYQSGAVMDERANAMAVLTGLADLSHRPYLVQVLSSCLNASTYMETFVIEALIHLNEWQKAHIRMMNRYNWLICNENSTLWEDFTTLGTKNHAWSGGPSTILYRYYLGLQSEDFYHTITLEPDFTNCNQYECSLDIRGHRLHIQCFLENPDTPQEIMYYHIDNETDAVIQVSGYHHNGQFYNERIYNLFTQ